MKTAFYKKVHLIALFLISSSSVFAQYFPTAEIKLNYNTVCFEYPFNNSADNYELVIYENDPANQQTYTSEANKIIVPNLIFGGSYYWKVLSKKGNKLVSESPVTHFSILSLDRFNDLRFNRVTQLKTLQSKEFLIYDYAKVMIDRNTDITWFLPETFEGIPVGKGVRDLKMTSEGTFLALIDSMGYEFDINGKVLWKAPNSGSISKQKNEDYHHDIQKLSNGNYMLLGNERIKHKFSGEKDSVTFDSGFVVEYSPDGRIVWSWRAHDFFTPELLSQRKKEDGTVNAATHMNSFQIDGDTLYVGFRDASWILKINRKTKKVEELYGGHDSGLPNHFATETFRFQHDTELIPGKRAIGIINNDSIADTGVVSSFLLFSLGDAEHKKGDLLLRFPFNYDNRTNGKSLKLGNVTPMKNGNYLINMGAMNRVVEIQPNKTIVWDFFTEKYDSTKNIWKHFQQYRVSTTTSLYPNEFSVKLSPKQNISLTQKGEMTIYNVGSLNFAYSVSVITNSGKSIKLSETPVIPSEKHASVSFEIPPNTDAKSIEIQAIGSNKKMHIPVLRK